MNIIISNSSGKPFYEQIASQIRGMIFSGELEEGEALPSMRSLAKDLRISLITTKRAYEDLERAGYIETVPGKGCFVAPKNMEVIREEQLRLAEDHLRQAAQAAGSCGIPLEELVEILKIYYSGE
ncbi:MAG: GntR family transcriptional regulator [Provencibacterium sp.]|nr:GntR family transcriptional regulator [Provencibacterium sp.]